MGKSDITVNLPTNASLSYTLDNLTSTVTLELTQDTKDSWQAFDPTLTLSEQSQTRFLNHLNRLKAHFNYQGNFVVKSGNSFPFGCGLASSASSFAALTRCAVMALCELTQHTDMPVHKQAMLSRKGSGSSCRSFYSPWAKWQDNSVEQVALPYETLLHQVIVISNKEKSVSSSQAHKLVTSSPHFQGRIERAETHLAKLLEALAQKNWQASFDICWDEFIDMHQLFQTAQSPFDYMTDECHTALHLLQTFWQKYGNGPIVTMDAGPNIHLLYRPQDKSLKEQFEQDHLKGMFNVI